LNFEYRLELIDYILYNNNNYYLFSRWEESGWWSVRWVWISSWMNVPWWASISFSGHGLVTVAWSIDSWCSIFRSWWNVIKNAREEVETVRDWSATFGVVSSHILGSFQGSDVWRPETGFVLHWFVHADHVKVLSEAGWRHFVTLIYFSSS